MAHFTTSIILQLLLKMHFPVKKYLDIQRCKDTVWVLKIGNQYMFISAIYLPQIFQSLRLNTTCPRYSYAQKEQRLLTFSVLQHNWFFTSSTKATPHMSKGRPRTIDTKPENSIYVSFNIWDYILPLPHLLSHFPILQRMNSFFPIGDNTSTLLPILLINIFVCHEY